MAERVATSSNRCCANSHADNGTEVAMLEAPDTNTANITRHEDLLKRDSTEYTHEDVRKLLADAKARLLPAGAEASKSKR